ncbi:hypothetical protein EI94DRAFT_1698129 [Lactarius quietus]|nr:hypothetical protein EI94DRAFT_1698129 [Lactarius quietus]
MPSTLSLLDSQLGGLGHDLESDVMKPSAQTSSTSADARYASTTFLVAMDPKLYPFFLCDLARKMNYVFSIPASVTDPPSLTVFGIDPANRLCSPRLFSLLVGQTVTSALPVLRHPSLKQSVDVPIRLEAISSDFLCTTATFRASDKPLLPQSSLQVNAARFSISISPNREFVALGFANLAGACLGLLPAYGSITRSCINADTGKWLLSPAWFFFLP